MFNIVHRRPALGNLLKTNRIIGNQLLTSVCRAVHDRRESLGISQEELAHRAGLHRTYISDIERGARNPSLKTLSRLADGLEITTSQLIKMGELEASGKHSEAVRVGDAGANTIG